MNPKDNMIPFERSLEIVDQLLASQPRPATATRAPLEAPGQVLAADVQSLLNLPPFDKAAMDGYAVMEGDRREEYDVIENVPAGCAPTLPLQPGSASRVMTGAPVPEGTGSVIKWEDTDNGMQRVRVNRHGDKTNICQLGEDVRQGATIYSRGQPLTPVTAANIISCGVTEVSVFNRVRIAILSTGDELTDDPTLLAPGMIMDTNGPMLRALALQHSLDVVAQDAVGDDLDQTAAAVDRLAAMSDVLIITGGVSAGDFDFVRPALQKTGFTIHFDEVAAQPGRPMTFATRDDCAVMGLPGNPVSVCNGFFMYVLRAAIRLTDGDCVQQPITAILARGYRRHRAQRETFAPARIVDGQLEHIRYHGSGHLLALGQADGFLRIPLGVKEIPAGGQVLFYPRPGH